MFAVLVDVDQAELDELEAEGGIEKVADQLRHEEDGGEFQKGEVLGVDIVSRVGDDLERENPRPALADLGIDLEHLGLG